MSDTLTVNSNYVATERKLLDPSELGTKEYWDAVYDRELHNHGEDRDDEGTVWFSENNAEEVVRAQLDKLEVAHFLNRNSTNDAELKASARHNSNNGITSNRASRFLDLGTGNGHMLFELREPDDEDHFWSGAMVGVDYSGASVQLARSIATQRQDGDDQTVEPIRFERWDILNESPGEWMGDGFDVVLDKGTFDAISLMPHEGGSMHPCEMYRSQVTRLVKPGFFLFVTSCNWTKEELLEWLAPTDGELAFFDEANYPTFVFGGQKGQSIVTVIFRRRTR